MLLRDALQFLRLADDDLLFQRIVANGRRVTWPEGHVVCVAGAPAEAFWLIEQGVLGACVPAATGLVQVGEVHPGEWVGEEALVDGPLARHAATLVARGPVQAIEVSVSALDLAPPQGKLAQRLRGLSRHRAHVRLEALFARLGDHGASIRSAWTTHHFDVGEVLFQAGEPTDSVFLVESGRVCEYEGEGARAHLVRIAEAGAWLGTDPLGSAGMPRTTARVLAPSCVSKLPAALVAAAMGQRPDAALDLEAVAWVRTLRHRGEAATSEMAPPSIPCPDQATLVCACLGLDRDDLETAREQGHVSAQALMRATGCGSVCGACRPSLHRLVPPSTWKTLLFLPQFAFEKATHCTADSFIVDFQDAVPLSAKAGARLGLRRALDDGLLQHRPVVVRINEAAMPAEQAADLDALVGMRGVYGMMPTMIERPEEVDALHAAITEREVAAGLPVGTYRLILLIETPGAVLRVDALAKAGGGRVVGLLLGHGDLLRLTGAQAKAELTMAYPRNAVVYAARAAGIAAFDTPYTRIDDRVGLEREAHLARAHGFDGKTCVHRNQLAIVERCLRPDSDERAWAERVEQARREGELQTLLKRVNGVSSGRGDRTTDGMARVDGQLVGPPHIKAAQRILSQVPPAQPVDDAVQGRVIRHRLAGGQAVGDRLPNPYELTITPGMRDLWQQCYYSHDPAITSLPYATALGLAPRGQLPCAHSLALYLCVSMSSTHGAIYHLGFRGGRMHAPVCVGETVRQRITLERVRNTRDGKRAVVSSHRALVRVEDGAVLYSVEKLELYPAQPLDVGADAMPLDLTVSPPAGDALWQAAARGARVIEAERQAILERSGPLDALAPDELLLHSFARPLGVSANLALSTLFLVTHPIHLDHHRYDVGDGQGVVVSGGLVIAQVIAAASRDISHVVWEELIAANNIRPVAPTDTVGALTYVLGCCPVAGYPELECAVIKTLGVRNLTPARDLAEVPLPRALFTSAVGGGGRYDELCRCLRVDALEGRIVAEVLRRVVRVRPPP